MATPAHCAYCFETLAAKFEKRTPLTLSQVEQLWEKAHPTLPSDDDDMDESTPPPGASPNDPTNRPAAISRLLAPSPSTRSSSSSTPSGVSEASSAASKNSSRSSIEDEEEGSPLFVTWNVIGKNGDTRLRGCIGTFAAQELSEGLSSYALTSALEDTRFPPIAPRELPTLECGVTLLTNFEPVADPMDWELGVHGLRISFSHKGRRYGSTYLPDVAKEQGWSKQETMVSLMRKAGWNGRSSEWRSVELSVVRYQGHQVKLGYAEWRAWREGV